MNREEYDPSDLDDRYEQNIVGQVDAEINPPGLSIETMDDGS